jgi:hypothetical protein
VGDMNWIELALVNTVMNLSDYITTGPLAYKLLKADSIPEY